jgi:glycerophosphoryl diester phosphodiesterase
MTRFSDIEGPMLLAHRGANREHTENTLPAFARALALGVDALELDVHLTADGYVVVSHDDDGRRLANAKGRICEHTLEEVRTWPLPGGERIPTLREVIEAFPQALLNVDVKQEAPDMVPTLLGLLRKLDAAERVLLTSFSANTVLRIRRQGYRGPTGLGQRDALLAVLAPQILAEWMAFGGRRLQIPLSFGPLKLGTRSVIDRAHALALKVDYWVVNDAALATQLLDHGADGIVTDVPEVMAQVFSAHPRTEGWRKRHGV